MNLKLACCATALLFAHSVAATAQQKLDQTRGAGSFPNRPVRMVNPYTPGGSVDIVSRGVSVALSEMWGQQVIVDNRAGAGTVIGTEIVARADPDGYTVLCTSSAIAIMPALYRNLRFDT